MAQTSTVFTLPLNGTKYVLTAINAEPLPALPTRLDHLPDTSAPRDTWRLHWAMAKYPQLPCIPATIRWDDPLLNRFAYNRSNMPIVSDSGSWRLCPKVTDSWLRFERALRFVAKELIAGCPNAWFPFESAFFPLPSNFGYRQSRTDRYHALQCAINSRDAFVPLMAWLTFLLTFYPSPDDSNSPWIKLLLQTGDVHPEWVEQMRSSWLGDLSGRCKRVGVVVDARSASVALVPQYVRARIPVWLLWSPADKPPSTFSPRLTQYYPKQEDVATALNSSSGVAPRRTLTESPNRAVPQPEKPRRSHAESRDFTTLPQAEPRHIPVEPSNREKFPKLPAGNRQNTGETWQQFFAREAESHAQIAKFESAADKARREKREQESLNYPLPGRKGPRVFEWDEVDGFWIRTPVTRAAVTEEWWDDIPNEHKRFNSFKFEWDICEKFDTTKHKAYEDLEDVVYDQPPMELAEVGDAPPTSCRIREVEGVEPLTGTAWRNDVLSLYGDAQAGKDDAEPYRCGSPPTFTDSLDQILYGRFGFNWQPSMGYEGPHPSEAMWKHDVGMVVQDNVSRLDSQYKGPIWKFITSLVQDDEERLQGLTWDLTAADNGDSLRHSIGENISIVTIADGSEIFYLLKPDPPATENTPEWHLVLGNPASALQSVRRSLSPNPAEVVRQLLANGIPFQTYIDCSLLASRVVPLSASLSNSLPPRPPISLGVRPPQYKPDAADYAAYEAARDNFLQQGHARAALLKGGIVWRLAVEYLGPNAVYTGPSERALTCGNVLYIDGKRHCDDSLTSDEVDFICGVYQVYTGHGFQVSHKSWWPKQATWEKSTYNVGYWTRFAEEWFQARLVLIRNNTATLKSATEWYETFGKKGKTLKLARINEKSARRFLDGHNFE